MSHLLDTDFVASFLKGIPRVVEFVRPMLFEPAAISIVTFAEIYEGIRYGREPEKHESDFAEFLIPVQIVGLDERVAVRYAALRGELRRQGNLIPDNDCSSPPRHWSMT